jgi:hypothetical protein
MLKTFTKNTKIQKFLATLAIVAMLSPTFFFSVPPKQVEAQWFVFDGVNALAWAKDLVGQAFKQVKAAIARKLTDKLTQGITKWVASGFSGNPFYLEKPESFFKDIVKFEVKNLVDIYAYNKAKFPFGKQFALDTINAYQKNIQDNTEYTLNRVIQDPVYLESYRNDFNVGGWNGFLINTQYPQNNYLGFQMIANEDLGRKLDGTATTAAQKVNKTLDQAGGFLAPKTCLDPNTKYNNGKNEFLQPSFKQKEYNDAHPFNCGEGVTPEEIACEKKWDADLEAAKAEWSKTNTCKNLAVTTPGSVVAGQAKKAIESKIDQANLGAAIGNAFAVGFGLLIDNLIDKGLTKLSGVLESKLYKDAQEGADSVNYQPTAPASNPVAVQVCQDISLDGGADGTNPDGTTTSLSFDGGGNACTNIAAPSGPPPDFSEIGKYKVPGTSGSGGGGGDGGACTGWNAKCTCAEGVATYDVYAGAVADAESLAYPSGLPLGTTGAQAQAAVCAKYAGPGACRAASQEDELIITGLPSPYVTLSIDFLIGGFPYSSNALYSRAVAACEAGVQ